MTLKINFSHHYAKMPYGFQESKLLDVLPTRLEDLSPEFLRYDTSYLDGGEEKQYQLPKKRQLYDPALAGQLRCRADMDDHKEPMEQERWVIHPPCE